MAYHVKQGRPAPAPAPAPVDGSLPRTCVIGAGSSGIAAAKALHMAGVPFDCFEQGPRIGGNWLYANPNGRSACYETLEINTSCPRMAFSDFPMPADYPPYARHDQVHRYFEDYVDHFGFRERITFDTSVDQVSREADGTWTVRTTGPDGELTRSYGSVLVANGHHWDPRWPEPAYPGAFAGEQIHAHEYLGGDQLAGRDVLVVGAGNSAMDIAVEASHRARSTTMSIRRGQWVLRKMLLGRAADQVALPGWLPWWATSLRLRLAALLSGSPARSGLPTPPHAPGQSHPVQSEQIRARLRAGAVTVRPGIERLDGDTVHFVDGSSARADLVVWATGYRVSFPFLDDIRVEGNDLPLWKRTVHPDLPGLYFIGLLQPIGAVMPLAEAQGRWVAEILTGRYAPPPARTIRAQMSTEHERNRRQFYASPRHTMEVDFDHYLWDLERERRRGAARAGGEGGRTPLRAPGGSARGDLSDRVVAVTGGAHGIGREIVRALAAAGARVVIGDRDEAAAAVTATELGDRVSARTLDVTDETSYAAFVADVEATHDRLDVLVSNAGVMWVGPFAEESEADARRMVDVNLLGVVRGVRLAAPAMVARGSGHLVTLASAASVLPTPGEATYAATKHGVLGYLRSVRAELHRSGVEITIVMPTVVDTEMAAGTATGAATLLTPVQVAEVVVESICRPRFEVVIPGYVGPLSRLAVVLPGPVRDFLYRRMVPDQVRQSDPSKRRDYEGRMRV